MRGSSSPPAHPGGPWVPPPLPPLPVGFPVLPMPWGPWAPPSPRHGVPSPWAVGSSTPPPAPPVLGISIPLSPQYHLDYCSLYAERGTCTKDPQCAWCLGGCQSPTPHSNVSVGGARTLGPLGKRQGGRCRDPMGKFGGGGGRGCWAPLGKLGGWMLGTPGREQCWGSGCWGPLGGVSWGSRTPGSIGGVGGWEFWGQDA